MTLEEEIREGYLVSSQMKKIWTIQLSMVKKILEVCHKYNLKIWAYGGTLLGAVRHNGYIPWDDDIDLVMFRDDFEKLGKIPSEEFAPYFYQTPYTDKGYTHPHAQLRDSTTAALLPNDRLQPFNQGIFIDIMVFDTVPEDETQILDMLKRRDNARSEIIDRNYFDIMISKRIGNILVSLKRYLKFKHYGLLKIYNDAESEIINFPIEESEYITSTLTNQWNYKSFIFKRTWYNKTILLPFEDLMIPAPSEYEKCLSTQYGDYMNPVKAPSTHGTVIFDTERSYKEVLVIQRSQRKFKDRIFDMLYRSPAT